ncbi:hypothetical protein [Psychromarinibacter sp. S121]|uniref:hypothetical protein n=1 Tax=Psychromarinibacter sp. S121 TaxID=3415127 RepID=UPI003C7D8D3F
MTIDIPHMIATAIVIFVVVFGISHLPAAETMSKGRKALLTFVVLFVVLMVMNMVWPSGTEV